MSEFFPRVAVKGAPFARGVQYGAQARERIRLCIESYRKAFRHRAGTEWEDALAHARRFQRDIEAFSPDSVQEMRGIAEGAGVDYAHILALNCRSELMFAALQQKNRTPEGECTSFAVLPEASADGHVLLGQNWDWVPFAREVSVFLEVQRDDGPSFVTVVEAGMLAKIGFNAAGLGLCTNTLVSTRDAGHEGVPYHIMLRALLDAESVAGASETLLSVDRALSANYLVAHRSGEAANFETTAGGPSAVRATRSEGGILAHANHFLAADLSASDSYVRQHPHSLSRLDAMRRGLAATRPGITVESLKSLLRDHVNAPNGVCSHPDPAAHPLSARATIASVVADLRAGTLWITAGPPCESDYRRFALPSVSLIGTKLPSGSLSGAVG